MLFRSKLCYHLKPKNKHETEQINKTLNKIIEITFHNTIYILAPKNTGKHGFQLLRIPILSFVIILNKRISMVAAVG